MFHSYVIFNSMEAIKKRFDELIPKVEDHNGEDHSIRYYSGDQVLGVIRCKLIKSVGKIKPIRQKYVMITTSDTKDLIDYLTNGDDTIDHVELSSTINKIVYDSVTSLIL